MGLCPVCGKLYCGHTAEDRGQTQAEMDRPLTPEELEAWKNNPDASGYVPEKIAAAQEAQRAVRGEPNVASGNWFSLSPSPDSDYSEWRLINQLGFFCGNF